MQAILFPFFGGLGLFLVGMMMLSDGLVAFAGASLQRALVRFTGTPAMACVSGTLATTLLQSSSATAVTLIGFVSAGLITFSQAIGVVIGASLGNTATGWIVAGLGLKVNLGFYTLPLIGVGAFLRLLTKGRWAQMGTALAGFGMLFLGLSMLQDGMRELSTIFSLADLPVGGLGAHVLIMLLGLALAGILQSSTAAIATTLTALHTGNINFDQAASLVVGAAIGTTMTGALAAIGGTIYAKRTALAYVLFNAATGLIAILLLPLFLMVIAWMAVHLRLGVGAVGLAAFHTLFIGVGVLLFLPLTARLAALVERMLPEPANPLAQRLDTSLLGIPAVALEASQRSLEKITERLLVVYRQRLGAADGTGSDLDLEQAQQALSRCLDFVNRIQLPAGDDAMLAQRIAQLHAVDHLMLLGKRLSGIAYQDIDFSAPDYQPSLHSSLRLLDLAATGLGHKDLEPQLTALEQSAQALALESHQLRHRLLSESAAGSGSSPAQLLQHNDVLRWLERSGRHVWRVCYYLAQSRLAAKRLARVHPDALSESESAPEALSAGLASGTANGWRQAP